MTTRCINWENIILDKCRFCNSYKIECKDYLSSIEHTQETNGSHADLTDKCFRFRPSRPEKPFYFGHQETIHNVVLPKNKILRLIRKGMEGIL